MLYVFTGGDAIAVRACAHRFLEQYEERGAQVEHIDAEVCTADMLRDRTLAQSLFLSSQAPEVTLLDMPSERAEALEAGPAPPFGLCPPPPFFFLGSTRSDAP